MSCSDYDERLDDKFPHNKSALRVDMIGDTSSTHATFRLPSSTVHCVVTSPPYWEMRDFGLIAFRWWT